MGSVEYHLKDGWKRLEVIRKNGIYAGKADIYIYSPDGNKFRSKKELSSYLTSNNLPYKVEELFTATDASGSTSAKAPEKGKKSSASDKSQASESAASAKKTAQASESAASSKKTAQVSDSAKTNASAGTSQPATVTAPSSQKNAAPAPQQSQKPIAPAPPTPTQKPVAPTPPPTQKAAAPAPASPGPGPHTMTTAPPQSTFNILKERLRSAGSPGSAGSAGPAGPAGPGKEAPANVSPFVQTPQGNPSFVPQRLGKSSADGRTLKPPKAPEKPLMPYMRYSRRVWDAVKAEHPDLKLWEIGKIIGQQWRDLPEELKAEFVEEYELEKVEYEKALRAYHNSPAYLNYIQAKNKANPSGDENREAQERPKYYERKIDIQAAEDDEDREEGYTVKHMAYARYVRNHKLMSEIFSDAVVPEVRFVVTTVRLQILRRQVHSLRMHQRKLESELEQAEEKFQTKKRRINDRCDSFQEEMKKYSSQPVDEEMFERMVQEQYEILKRELMSKAAASGNAAGSVPSSTIVAPPENFESQAGETNKKEESQEQGAAAAAAAAAAPTPVPESMDTDMPTPVFSATATDLMDNYSGVVYFPPAPQGHYPVQPVSVPVPSRQHFQYPHSSQQGYYPQYQTGGYAYLQYSPYPRAQYFLADNPLYQGFGNVAPTGVRSAEHNVQQVESQPRNAPQYLDEQVSAEPSVSGQEE